MVRVVSLCDLTGTMVRPWAEAGYDAVCYDLQHSIRADKVEQVGAGSITYRWADVRSLTATDIGRPSIVFAFPPCTHLANSGNRDKRRKGLRLLIDSLELVEACRVLCENSGAPYLIENPVGSLSTYWREPDERFNPCDFAGYLADPFPESYTKKTLLWMGGGAGHAATSLGAPCAQKQDAPALAVQGQGQPPQRHSGRVRAGSVRSQCPQGRGGSMTAYLSSPEQQERGE
jgi:hypothetical protein